jgi:DNA-binding MarR family transcriptional regulator
MKRIEDAIKQGHSFRNTYHKTSVNLIYTGRWIFNLHNDLFSSFGLTLQQYNVLRILKGQFPKSASVKLIRERIIDKMSDASRIVENLRKKSLVERNLNASDRRSVDVIITLKGIKLLNSIERKASKTLDNFLSNLNKKEIKQLNILLDKLRD